jgi:hypothetical protein
MSPLSSQIRTDSVVVNQLYGKTMGLMGFYKPRGHPHGVRISVSVVSHLAVTCFVTFLAKGRAESNSQYTSSSSEADGHSASQDTPNR